MKNGVLFSDQMQSRGTDSVGMRALTCESKGGEWRRLAGWLITNKVHILPKWSCGCVFLVCFVVVVGVFFSLDGYCLSYECCSVLVLPRSWRFSSRRRQLFRVCFVLWTKAPACASRSFGP